MGCRVHFSFPGMKRKVAAFVGDVSGEESCFLLQL